MTGAPSENEVAAMLLLEEALDLPSGERADYIRGRDDQSVQVRAAALELLASTDAASNAVRTGGPDALAEAGMDADPDIPGYRIVRKIGQGGMGAVYLAERQDADFEHRVAIKVIRPGALSDALVERFRRERRFLASLNHPGIARLYDGAETEAGQPYIVMEYVPGRTMRQWLAEDAPPLDRRLALFRQALLAVEYAHQNLVVHSDLTPGNILVSDDGRARLIDFGIARPHHDVSGQAAASTLSGLSLTPGFAAPERMHGLGANTLSDVYSLGRILELLAQGSNEAELQAIADKASATAPEARYASVRELVEEIDRFRDGRPVAASGNGRGYRLRKFVRRERTLVAAGTALVLALAAGLGASTWSYLRAERARVDAERRFSDLRTLANTMMFGIFDKVAAVPGTTRAQEEILRTSLRYLDSLSADGTAPADVRFEVAQGYDRLAKVTGGTIGASLGKLAEGEKLQQRALAMLEQAWQADPARKDIASALAVARIRAAGDMLYARGDMDGALRTALAARDLLPPPDKADEAAAIALLDTHRYESEALGWKGKTAEGIAAADRGIAASGQFAKAIRDDPAVRFSLARLIGVKGTALAEKGDLKASVGALRDALALRKAAMPASDPLPGEIRNLTINYYFLAKAEAGLGSQDAMAHAREGLALARESVARDPADVGPKELFAGMAVLQAAMLVANGDPRDAVRLAEEGIVRAREVAAVAGNAPGARMSLAVRLHEASDVFRAAGNRTRQCAAVAEAVGYFRAYEKAGNEIPAPDRKNNLEPMEAILNAC